MTRRAPLNLIVNGFHDAYHEPVWRALFERYPIASIEAILGERTPAFPAGVAVTKHNFFDLSYRAHYGVPMAQLRALEAPLLDELAGVESTFLRMADRLEAVSPTSYQRRKELFLRHVRYWNDVLERRRIDAVIFSNVPHETYDFVLQALCLRRGIPTLSFLQTQVEDSFIALEDWRDPLPGAEARLRELEEARNDLHPYGLSGRFLAHLERQCSTGGRATPFYMQETARPPLPARIRRLATRLGSPRAWPNRLHVRYANLRLDARTQALRRAYDRLAQLPSFAEPFVYVALHYQPELTTSPLAEVFVDQALIVELLAASAPAGMKIFVKEHPKQTAIARDPDLYARLAAIPNVVLVRRDADTYALIQHATAVATCTGTAGWEALFRGKPVLMFGRYMYQYARGVHRIRTTLDATRALAEILAGRGIPTLADTARFLHVLAERSHEGYVDGVYRAVSRLDDARSAANVGRVLCDWLDAAIERSAS